MNIYWWVLVIFLTSLGLLLAAGWYLSRPGQIPLDRLADPRPLLGELPRAARFTLYEDEMQQFYGASQTGQPFDLTDTGPLLFLSDKAAALATHEREVRAMIEAAEREIGPTP